MFEAWLLGNSITAFSQFSEMYFLCFSRPSNDIFLVRCGSRNCYKEIEAL